MMTEAEIRDAVKCLRAFSETTNYMPAAFAASGMEFILGEGGKWSTAGIKHCIDRGDAILKMENAEAN